MRRLTVVGTLLVTTAVAYVVLFTPVLGVRQIEVAGVREMPADEVRAAAAVEAGTPLARLDTDEVAERVAQLPRVAGVDVRRSLPGTLEILITERTPVAVIVAEDGFHLVDVEGVAYSVKKKRPPELPTLKAAEPAAVRAAVTVLGSVPDKLRPKVRLVDAQSPHNVRLTLADGRLVKWGGVEDSHRKSAVLGPLLTQPGKTYDVAAPEFPTIG